MVWSLSRDDLPFVANTVLWCVSAKQSPAGTVLLTRCCSLSLSTPASVSAAQVFPRGLKTNLPHALSKEYPRMLGKWLILKAAKSLAETKQNKTFADKALGQNFLLTLLSVWSECKSRHKQYVKLHIYLKNGMRIPEQYMPDKSIFFY